MDRTGERERGASIKGVALQSVVEDVWRLRDAGRVDDALLEARTKPGDRYLLDELPAPSLWYPVDGYGRLLDLLWEVEGAGDPSYPVARGARAAERILAAGIYARVVETAEKWGGDHVGRAVLNLATGFYDFTRWDLRGSSADAAFSVEVEDAADLPEVARLTAQGFLEVLFGRTGPARVTSERTATDRVVFRVERPAA